MRNRFPAAQGDQVPLNLDFHVLFVPGTPFAFRPA